MSDVLENTLSFDDHDVLMRSIGEEIENAEGLNSLLEKGIDLNKLIDELSVCSQFIGRVTGNQKLLKFSLMQELI